MICAQEGALPASFNSSSRVPIIRFPELSFGALWPLNAENPYNIPEPPKYPHGRFPYGDSFIAASVQRGTKPEEIIQFCFSQIWPESWPDLENLFRGEAKRLLDLDERNDVKIGAYIIRGVTSRRLFTNINTQSDSLLAALGVRLIRHLRLKWRLRYPWRQKIFCAARRSGTCLVSSTSQFILR